MRGDDNQQEGMFSYISPEKRVPADHPLRPIRKMVDEILKEMSPQFAKLYSEVGRPSIAPERLFRSLLLQIFYSVRSERLLIEQLQYNLLFRWFVGMEMDEPAQVDLLMGRQARPEACGPFQPFAHAGPAVADPGTLVVAAERSLGLRPDGAAGHRALPAPAGGSQSGRQLVEPAVDPGRPALIQCRA